MANTILIDAGPLIALFDRDDKYHERMLNFIQGGNYKFVTTLAVITEVSYMLNFNVHVQLDFFQWVLRRGLILADVNQHDVPRIIELIKKYQDRPMDFADATLVLTSEKTGIKEIISIDSDFDIYRLPGKELIRNVFC